MGNQTGKPWRNPEDDLIRGRFEQDHIPPPTRRPADDNPLYRPPPQQTGDQLDREAYLRAFNMDCVKDTVEFAKWPAALGLGWGATMAAVHAKPDLKQLNQHIGARATLGVRGFLRELRYLPAPALRLGGFAALYSLTNCSVAKLRDRDTWLNSAVAGSVSGIAYGIFQRNPNLMFIYGTWGFLAGAIAKWAYLDPTTHRPRATYYEIKEYRNRSMSAGLRQEAAEDGYVHAWLDPQLAKLGIQVPETWTSAAVPSASSPEPTH